MQQFDVRAERNAFDVQTMLMATRGASFAGVPKMGQLARGIRNNFTWSELDNAYRAGTNYFARGIPTSPNMVMPMQQPSLQAWLDIWGHRPSVSFETKFVDMHATSDPADRFPGLRLPQESGQIDVGADLDLVGPESRNSVGVNYTSGAN